MISPEKQPRRSGLSIQGLLEVCSALLCITTVTAFLGRAWWVFELTSHFRVQSAVALLVLSAIWTWRRRTRLAATCGLLAMVHGAVVAPHFWPNA